MLMSNATYSDIVSDNATDEKIRRLAERAMMVLEYEPLWSNPMSRIAVFAAITRVLKTLIIHEGKGETAALEEALSIVSCYN